MIKHKEQQIMQFLTYNPTWNPEAFNEPPSQELMDAMEKFICEAVEAGVILTTGSLRPNGTRLKLSDGKFSITDAPFIELKELLAGFAVLQVDSLEEAIEWCKRFQNVLGEGETEIVQLLGPDDFGPA